MVEFKIGLCKVFDRKISKFVALKSDCFQIKQGFGDRKQMFRNKKEVVLFYDVEKKNKWSKEKCQPTNNLEFYSSVKIPFYLKKKTR